MKMIGAVTVLATSAMITTSALAEKPDEKGGRGSGPIIFVESQGLYFDSIVLADLRQKGRFQQLNMAGPTGLATMYGPGDVGYLGGRWWVDANGDGYQNEGDLFFMCPLLGPGRLDP